MTADIYDLCVIGGGPAGLSTAISGASELSRVILFDSGKKDESGARRSVLGGQAHGSSLIENYAGFPEGVSGPGLIERFAVQARRLGAHIACPERAASLEMIEDSIKLITTREGAKVRARTVVLANGLSYRKLDAEGVDTLLGKGVMYGAPTTNALQFGECTVCVVGAANSAGQAAMHFAANPKCTVHMLVRGDGLGDTMSQYLFDRVVKQPNIDVITHATVKRVVGDERLSFVTIERDGVIQDVPTDHLFVFIGAAPKVEWLDSVVEMDDKKFIKTGSLLFTPSKLRFETSMSGVFAAGDIRLGNQAKRVAVAVGEGAGVIRDVHEYLNR